MGAEGLSVARLFTLVIVCLAGSSAAAQHHKTASDCRALARGKIKLQNSKSSLY